MIKRTLYFGNPAYLSLQNSQLLVKLPEVERNPTLSSSFKANSTASIPIEDIGVLVLDHTQITITQALLSALVDNSTALITCDASHHPTAMLLPLIGNSTLTERYRDQIEASQPLKKQLWAQTIAAKIENQAQVLKQEGYETENMQRWADKVRSGDPDNYEARAAAYYWQCLSGLFAKYGYPNYTPENEQDPEPFRRERHGIPPNNALNYGYAIIRAIAARALVISGLLPALGIFHRNKYNAYCLADDIMEPYRPVADALVIKLVKQRTDLSELSKDIKQTLLSLPTTDVMLDGDRSPLMVALSRTTANLAKCYSGESRKMLYPEIIH